MLLALVILLIFQAIDNPEALPVGSDVRWRELVDDSKIPMSTATDVVLALLAVEATLSIALAVGAPAMSLRDDVKSYAGAFAWAQIAVVVAVFTAALALAVASTQWFSRESVGRAGAVTILSFVALLAVALSAAITRYAGQETYDRVQTRRSLKELNSSDWASRRLKASRLPIGVARASFAGIIGISVSALIVGWQYISGTASPYALPWPVRLLYGTGVVALLVTVVVGLTSGVWKSKRGTSTVDLLISRLLRAASLVGLTATFTAVAVSVPSYEGRMQVGLLIVGGLWLPAVLLYLARKSGRGPAVFAVRAHIEWAARRREKLQEYLNDEESDLRPVI
ncbi:hypothetical protein [uncultured Modestobacter sp.]|uniref:hypothetical protein n=1 Tax=uncultured Modestobacter sp. TaxID=380048 RepID=UPI00262D298E|nr:hypothetical protein [uncultured Modestobacter sp.]